MDDFVIPRKENGEKNENLSFKVKSQALSDFDLYSLFSNEVKESLNGGCPQEVIMWRNFANFCRAYDNDDETLMKKGKDLLSMSLENQLIVDALMESIRHNGKIISLPK